MPQQDTVKLSAKDYADYFSKQNQIAYRLQNIRKREQLSRLQQGITQKQMQKNQELEKRQESFYNEHYQLQCILARNRRDEKQRLQMANEEITKATQQKIRSHSLQSQKRSRQQLIEDYNHRVNIEKQIKDEQERIIYEKQARKKEFVTSMKTGIERAKCNRIERNQENREKEFEAMAAFRPLMPMVATNSAPIFAPDISKKYSSVRSSIGKLNPGILVKPQQSHTSKFCDFDE